MFGKWSIVDGLANWLPWTLDFCKQPETWSCIVSPTCWVSSSFLFPSAARCSSYHCSFWERLELVKTLGFSAAGFSTKRRSTRTLEFIDLNVLYKFYNPTSTWSLRETISARTVERKLVQVVQCGTSTAQYSSTRTRPECILLSLYCSKYTVYCSCSYFNTINQPTQPLSTTSLWGGRQQSPTAPLLLACQYYISRSDRRETFFIELSIQTAL